jgi:hypothetical protein
MPEIRHLLTPEMKELIEDYYGSYFKVVFSSFYRNVHLPQAEPSKETYSDRWHCDRMPSDLLTIMINLHPVAEQNGPFHIVSRPRTRELMRLGFRDRADYGLPPAIMEDPRHVVQLTGEAGGVMICDNQCCLHRAGVVGPGRLRDVGSFQVAPSTVPLAEDWIDRIELTVPERAFLERTRIIPPPRRAA